MRTIFEFKLLQPKKPIFAVVQNVYNENINHYYYLSDCKKRYGNVYSYAAIENNHCEWRTSHDLMHYLWCNAYHISGCPKFWRPMTVTEAHLFSETLFRFGRPSWAHPKGKNPLSLQQCELLTKF